MNNNTKITEDDLHAYVDGQLSGGKFHAVEALILKDSQVAKQVNEWQKQNKLLQQHFNKDHFSDVPNRLNISKIQASQVNNAINRPWYISLAASILMMAIGGALGWFMHGVSQTDISSPGFANSAISAYQVFSVEVRHPVEVRADEKDHLVTWLSKRIDHPLKMPELKEFGFKLLGGRLLSMKKGQPAAQFMFENNEGKRVTWLVSKSASYRDKSFLFKTDNNVNTYYWMDSSVAYSISGEIEREDLLKLSEDVYQQINELKPKQLAGL